MLNPPPDRLKPPDPALDRLISEVYSDPLDMDLREVLADAWQERGDPRGECTALGLRKLRRLAFDEKRLQTLERAGRSWLGALGAVVRLDVSEWRAGFLHRAGIAWQAPSPVELAAVLIAPEWQTVRSIYLHDSSPDWLNDLWGSAPLHHLDSIENIALRLVPDIRHSGVSRIRIQVWDEDEGPPADLLDGAVLPRLSTLDVVDHTGRLPLAAILRPGLKNTSLSTEWGAHRLESEAEQFLGSGLDQLRLCWSRQNVTVTLFKNRSALVHAHDTGPAWATLRRLGFAVYE